MQFAQHGGAVDASEAAAFVDHLAGHHDEVDALGLAALEDGV